MMRNRLLNAAVGENNNPITVNAHNMNIVMNENESDGENYKSQMADTALMLKEGEA